MPRSPTSSTPRHRQPVTPTRRRLPVRRGGAAIVLARADRARDCRHDPVTLLGGGMELAGGSYVAPPSYSEVGRLGERAARRLRPGWRGHRATSTCSACTARIRSRSSASSRSWASATKGRAGHSWKRCDRAGRGAADQPDGGCPVLRLERHSANDAQVDRVRTPVPRHRRASTRRRRVALAANAGSAAAITNWRSSEGSR